MRQSARQVELQTKFDADRVSAEEQAKAEKLRYSEGLKLLQEQLLDVIPNEQEEFELPLEIKMAEKGGSNKGGFRTKKGLPFGVPHYRTLKRNFYKAPLYRPHLSENDDIPVCSCTPRAGCGPLCQNRILFMECVPGHCPTCVNANGTGKCDDIGERGRQRNFFYQRGPFKKYDGDLLTVNEEFGDEDEHEGEDGVYAEPIGNEGIIYCENTIIQRKKFPKTEVIDPESGCGFGLQVMEDVGAGTILIEYLGEVITQDECNERMAQCDEHDDFYFASLGGGLYLDAKPMGSVARFANHSCNPSCELQKWNVRGEPRICLVNARPMKAGEEITYNYQYYEDGFDSAGMDEKDTAAFRRQKCLCGSDNCCGTIGGKVEESTTSIWFARARRILDASSKAGPRMVLSDVLELISKEVLEDAKVAPGSTEVVSLKELADLAYEWLKYGSSTVPLELCNFEELDIFSFRVAPSTPAISITSIEMCASAGTTIPEAPPFVSLPDLHEVIKAVPNTVRFLATPTLKLAAKRASDAERSIRELLAMLEHSQSASTNTTGDNSSSEIGCNIDDESIPKIRTQIEGKMDPRIYWEDLVVAIRQIASSLPVLVAPDLVWHILELYQECSDWCRRWLSSLRPVMVVKSSVHPSPTSPSTTKQQHADANSGENMEMERVDKLLWEDLMQVSSAYNSNVTCDYFVVRSFLENRIIAAMARPSFRDAVSRTKGTNVTNGTKKKHGVVGLSETVEKGVNPAHAEENLHCFCQLLEHEGELGVLAMCESCHRWYHPTCLNSTSNRINNNKFYCPLCCIDNRLNTGWNRMSLAPIEEYAIKPGQDRMELKEKQTVGGGQGMKKGPKGSHAKTNKKRNRLSSGVSGPRVHQPHAKYQLYLLTHPRPTSAKHRGVELSLPRAGQGDYLTASGLTACLREEGGLRVCATGVQRLLEVIRTFLVSWNASVQAFVGGSALKNSLCESEITNSSTSIDYAVSDFNEDLNASSKALSRHLDQCLQLYYAPRVVRVRPVETLNVLRKIAWALSVYPVASTLPLPALTNSESAKDSAGSTSSAGVAKDVALDIALKLERRMIQRYGDPTVSIGVDKASERQETSTSSAREILSSSALVALMRREIRCTVTTAPLLSLSDLNGIVHGAASLGLPTDVQAYMRTRNFSTAPPPASSLSSLSSSSLMDITNLIDTYALTLTALRTACRHALAQAQAFISHAMKRAISAVPAPAPTLFTPQPIVNASGVAQAVTELCSHALQLSQNIKSGGGGGASPEAAVGLVRNLADGISSASSSVNNRKPSTPTVPTLSSGVRSDDRKHLSFDKTQMTALCAICLRLRALGHFVDLSGHYPYCATLSFLVHITRNDKMESLEPASGAVPSTDTDEGDDLGSGTDCDSVTEGDEKDSAKIEVVTENRESVDDEEYCWCLRGEGPHVGQMIACDVCEEWFHVHCVTRGLTQKAANKLASFVCCACETARGEPYKHAW